GARRALLGGVGVLTRVPLRPALAQHVPRLVQRDLELALALELVLAEAFTDVGLLEPLLLGGELVDVLHDVLVVHGQLRSKVPENSNWARPSEGLAQFARTQ